MEARINNVTLALTDASPYALPVDALVLESEPSLRLSPALAAYVGIDVQRELASVGRIDVGEAVITSGGTTPFLRLIHAITPRWGEGSERGKLMNASRTCLHLAEANGMTSVALPAFSVGQRGYPVESCAAIMLTEMFDYTFEELEHLSRIVLYCDSPAIFEAFQSELERQLQKLADEP